MKTKEKAFDHPGVYPPPPLFYVVIFIISVFTQKTWPISSVFFETDVAEALGMLFVVMGILVLLPALIKFLKTKNTLITIKPANSLQTSGIYNITRNPMYLGLLSVYIGVAFFKGNWWTLLFVPLVILIINYFVIFNEEKYLTRAFGSLYIDYRNKVRRWI